MKRIIPFVTIILIASAMLEQSLPADSQQVLNDAQKKDILSQANTIRCETFDKFQAQNQVKGLAHPGNLVWNEDLERIAQDASRQCQLANSRNKEQFVFGLYVENPEFQPVQDLLTTLYFQAQVKKGLLYLSSSDIKNFKRTNVFEQLAAEVLSDQVTSFGCAASNCFSSNEVYFNCVFDALVAEGEQIYTIQASENSKQKGKSEVHKVEEAPQPIVIEDGFFTEDEKDQIVKQHNLVRAQLAKGQFIQVKYDDKKKPVERAWPAATQPIPELEWDFGLENSAQQIADQCSFKHSNAHQLFMKNTGENLFASAWKANPTFVVKGWANEGKDPDAIPISYQSSLQQSLNPQKEIGHFTQVVWQKTLQVGCARRHCSQLMRLENGQQVFSDEFLVVCQYSPAGNIIGEPIYV